MTSAIPAREHNDAKVEDADELDEALAKIDEVLPQFFERVRNKTESGIPVARILRARAIVRKMNAETQAEEEGATPPKLGPTNGAEPPQ